MADRIIQSSCQTADDLFKKGQSALKKRVLFGSKKSNYQKAALLFGDAAQLYMSVHLYEESGHAYLAKAEALVKAENEKDAAEAYSDAADAYERMMGFEGVNTEKMAECLNAASRISFEQGAIQRAARILKDLGERLTMDQSNPTSLELATEALYKSADYYGMENAHAHVNDCYEKAAIALGYKEDWQKASRAWQKILFAEHNKQKGSSGTKSLIQFKTNKYIFRSVLCQLAGLKTGYMNDDLELIENDLDMLTDAYGYNFEKNREYDLLQLFLVLFKEKDLKKLKAAIQQAPQVIQEDDHSKFLLAAVADKLEKASKHVGEVDLT